VLGLWFGCGLGFGLDPKPMGDFVAYARRVGSTPARAAGESATTGVGATESASASIPWAGVAGVTGDAAMVRLTEAEEDEEAAAADAALGDARMGDKDWKRAALRLRVAGTAKRVGGRGIVGLPKGSGIGSVAGTTSTGAVEGDNVDSGDVLICAASWCMAPLTAKTGADFGEEEEAVTDEAEPDCTSLVDANAASSFAAKADESNAEHDEE